MREIWLQVSLGVTVKPSGLHSVSVDNLELKITRCRKWETKASICYFLGQSHQDLSYDLCLYPDKNVAKFCK